MFGVDISDESEGMFCRRRHLTYLNYEEGGEEGERGRYSSTAQVLARAPELWVQEYH
jgi:hypothetical protein